MKTEKNSGNIIRDPQSTLAAVIISFHFLLVLEFDSDGSVPVSDNPQASGSLSTSVGGFDTSCKMEIILMVIDKHAGAKFFTLLPPIPEQKCPSAIC